MAGLPAISSRAMMSGWCVYSDKVPFAFIIENQLYLKAKGVFADKLASLGWTRFSYEKSNGKTITMCYWGVPEDLLDNQGSFNEIVGEALASLEK